MTTTFSQKQQGDVDGAAPRAADAVGVEKRVVFVSDAGVAYASGDLIADAVEVTLVADAIGGGVNLDQVTLYDKSDNTAFAGWLVFADAATSFGTINAAPNISDANAIANHLKPLAFAAADWVDVGGIKVLTLRNVNLKLHCAAATRSLWVGIVNSSGTPTEAAAGDLLADLNFA